MRYVLGHLDSCSQILILSVEFAEKLHLPLGPCSLEVCPFSPGKVTNNKLTRHPVTVRIVSVKIKQLFLVCDLQSPFNCLLGTGAFEKFNLFIGSLQFYSTNSEDVEVPHCVSPLQYNLPSDPSESEKISTSIDSVPKTNLSSTSGFCNLPNA